MHIKGKFPTPWTTGFVFTRDGFTTKKQDTSIASPGSS